MMSWQAVGMGATFVAITSDGVLLATYSSTGCEGAIAVLFGADCASVGVGFGVSGGDGVLLLVVATAMSAAINMMTTSMAIATRLPE